MELNENETKRNETKRKRNVASFRSMFGLMSFRFVLIRFVFESQMVRGEIRFDRSIIISKSVPASSRLAAHKLLTSFWQAHSKFPASSPQVPDKLTARFQQAHCKFPTSFWQALGKVTASSWQTSSKQHERRSGFLMWDSPVR